MDQQQQQEQEQKQQHQQQQYATPFLILNLGSEMVFVIAQRLNAQNIPTDKSDFGMNTIFFI